MREYFIWSGLLLCLFSLWAIARHDWIRVIRPRCEVLARVTGHRLVADSEGPSYAACYTFEVEGTAYVVTDQLAHSYRKAKEDEWILLAYPEGRPDLARPPRLWMWAVVYLLLSGMAALLAAEGLWPGFMPHS